MDQEKPRRNAPRKVAQSEKLVESVNSLSAAEFAASFNIASSIKSADLYLTDRKEQGLSVRFFSASELQQKHQNVLDACFHLIEQSSADDYKTSEMKWSPSKKRREMVLPDMKFLVVQQAISTSADASDLVQGFVSFMVTYEDGLEVVYIYEIHLAPDLRSHGIGKLLMRMVEEVARRVGVEKCMLTVFRANQKAVAWYDHLGYSVDDYSPQPRILRNGSIKEPTYLILSKPSKS